MLKLSRFTIQTLNNKDEVLLYNSFVGTKSFCKLSLESRNAILATIGRKEECYEYKDIINKLTEKGHLVDINDNELEKLRLLYLDTVVENTLRLIILPTEKCNFSCVYCYESFEKPRMTEVVQKDIVDYVRKNISRYKHLRVLWFGGEPTIELEIIQKLSKVFIDICRKNRIVYSAQITTNGYLLTTEMFKSLLDCEIRDYQITIDGIQRIHDKYRVDKKGSGTYEIIMNNIHQINSDYSNERYNIIIRTNLTQEIFDYMEEYVNQCNDLVKNSHHVKIDVQFVNNWKNKVGDAIKSNILDDDLSVIFFERLLNCSESLKGIITEEFELGGLICYAGRRNSILIRPNGEVHKCTMCFEEQHDYIGTISFKSNYNIDMFSKWLSIFNYCKEIDKCDIAPLCLGDCCPAQRILTNEGEKCPRFRKFLVYKMQLLDMDNKFVRIDK